MIKRIMLYGSAWLFLLATSGEVFSQAVESLPKAKAAKAAKSRVQPVYTVAKYDPKRNAARDLAATVKRAKAEQKRIILEVGGNW